LKMTPSSRAGYKPCGALATAFRPEHDNDVTQVVAQVPERPDGATDARHHSAGASGHLCFGFLLSPKVHPRGHGRVCRHDHTYLARLAGRDPRRPTGGLRPAGLRQRVAPVVTQPAVQCQYGAAPPATWSTA